MNRRSGARKGMVMIFVAVLIVAAATVVMSSVDLSRMATLRQSQQEREAIWNNCLDSARAIATEELSETGTISHNLDVTINSVPITIQSASLYGWSYGRGCQVTVTGTIQGQQRQSTLYLGRRLTVNPAAFACVVTNQLSPGSKATLKCLGDVYCPTNTTGTGIDARSNAYAPMIAMPSFTRLSGQFIGRQPPPRITLDDSKYLSAADVKTSGTLSLSDPAGPTSWTNSKLYFHSGNLTISGTVTGRVTVYVVGSATISNIQLSNNSYSRLVVIVHGDTSIVNGNLSATIISTGNLTFTSSGSTTISGSLACGTIANLTNDVTINYDSYFDTWNSEAARFKIPGQW